MARVKDEQLFSLIKNFFLVYLPIQVKASPNTVKAYRAAWNQFLTFAADVKGVPLAKVTMEMLDYNMVVAYLDWITNDRAVKATTRNQRLAAIRAFFTYISACKPEYMECSSQLSSIPIQKSDSIGKVDYMSEEAVKALMEAPDVSTRIGLRDQFLMVMLYDTGARIQEILDIRICDIRTDGTPTVTLHGKGNKVRVVPLMKETVAHIKRYLKVFHADTISASKEPLFYVERQRTKYKMCDDTVRIRLKKYVKKAKEKCGDVPDDLHPHHFRHSRAMHLYQHGMDLTLVSQWLGHSQLETTLVYAYADTEHKRRAIEAAMGTSETDKPEEPVYMVSDEEIIRKLYGL